MIFDPMTHSQKNKNKHYSKTFGVKLSDTTSKQLCLCHMAVWRVYLYSFFQFSIYFANKENLLLRCYYYATSTNFNLLTEFTFVKFCGVVEGGGGGTIFNIGQF